MRPLAYYNENDPYAAQWLRNLIENDMIAAGHVDERDIREVSASDLRGFTQCHFFAGVGIWSHVMRLAGWPDDRPVWTGSCPCQPFSDAGQKKGFDDERHLWPTWFRLVDKSRPVVLFGEQVASKDGLLWFDTVQSDLEDTGYAVGSCPAPAASLGAPHWRLRNYFGAVRMGDTFGKRLEGFAGNEYGRTERAQSTGSTAATNATDVVADTMPTGRTEGWSESGNKSFTGFGTSSELADADGGNPEAERLQRGGQHGQLAQDAGVSYERRRPGPVNGFWAAADWLFCRDERWRPVEPGTFPLVNGATARVGRLRAYGNALVAPQAASFVRDFDESIRELNLI